MADPTAAQRRMFAKMGIAMPDGSYYIRNADDLDNAIKAVGHGEGTDKSGAEIRRHIMKRAAALKLSSRIPDTWNPDGTLKHDLIQMGEDFIAHFGRKGMKWGEHIFTADPGGSADHNRAKQVDHLIKTKGLKAASNNDLQDLITRLNLESQHARLTATPSRVESGHNFVRKTLGYTKTGLDVAKTGLDAVETGKRVHKVVAGAK